MNEGASNDVGLDDSGAYRGTSSRFPVHVVQAWLPIASSVPSMNDMVHHRERRLSKSKMLQVP
jgi:ribosomal protein S12 methylthiotransferase accessory factor YcaO